MKMKFKDKTIIFFLLFFLLPFRAEAQRIRGTNISFEEGDWISYTQCRYINSIQVTPILVYAASEGGILRYDYHARKWLFPFTISNGLPDNNVLVAAYDISTNLLWCATEEAISVYHQESKMWENSYLDEVGLPFGDPVVSIGFDNQNVWIETQSGNYFRSPSQFLVLSPEDKPSEDFINWVGKQGFVPIRLQQYNLNNSMMFIDNAVEYFIQDNNLRDFRFNYYVIDNWQTLWAGTNGLGMFSGNTRTGNMQHKPFGLLNPDVKAIYKDQKNIWIGGNNQDPNMNGISVWEYKRDRWSYFEPKYISRFSNMNIRDISSTNESVWFATENGLVRYQKDKDRWRTYTVFDNLRDNNIYSIAGDDSTLWVGSRDGLDRITNIRGKMDSISISPITPGKDEVSVFDILVDKNIVWAGTNWGLFYYDKSTRGKGFYRGVEGPGVGAITAIAKLGDSLWVSTLNTIEVYDVKNKVWRGSPARKVFDGTLINDIAATKNSIWVGTDNGLYKHNLIDKYWRNFTTDDGLLDSVVQKILPDQDYLYIGSPQGLTKFYWNSPNRID